MAGHTASSLGLFVGLGHGHRQTALHLSLKYEFHPRAVEHSGQVMQIVVQLCLVGLEMVGIPGPCWDVLAEPGGENSEEEREL